MKNDQIDTFLLSADEALVNAVRSVCRKRFPKTVAALDGLSSLEWDAVRSGGLQSLSKSKLSAIEKAMRRDKFVWSSDSAKT